MTPTFSRGRSGRLYRYYVSVSLQKGAARQDDRVMRLSAIAIEKLVAELVTRLQPNARAPLEIPLAVRLREQELLLDLPGNFAADMSVRLQAGERLLHSTRHTCRISIPLIFRLRGGKKTIAIGSRKPKPDQSLIKALRKAHSMMELY